MKSMKKVLVTMLTVAAVSALCLSGGAEEPAVESAPVQMEAAAPEQNEMPEIVAENEAPETAEIPAQEEAQQPEEAAQDAEISDIIEEELAEEPAVEAFTGKVSLKLENEGEIFLGDEVVLTAEVKDANLPYAIRWDCFDPATNEWREIAGQTGTRYTFIADEANTACGYRAVLVVTEEQ